MTVQQARDDMGEGVDIDINEGVATTHRTIGKSGNSLVIRIPPNVLEFADIERGDRVQLIAKMGEKEIAIKHIDELDANELQPADDT
jgi:antitoxin component of MazEF toxin-antitoxin module